ncbi:MAG: hypothetical protein CMG71_07090 [Candidatus Marinimicrobia bacterium]|nr:hypothetical protein [Candidatus Neomarinimicrobiota bacterium]|tara:strand:- start:2493 stop:3281 length:789 start_codon:yes stop_codon:yes gene_type:complete
MVIERASVTANELIAEGIFQMNVSAPKIAGENPSPGQFINISVIDSWFHPLRRPMSIAGREGESLKIIYKIFGAGTRLLSEFPVGSFIDLLGPLGNTFELTEGATPVLVGGGVGLAPILWFDETLRSNGIDHTTIIGARHSGEHFLEHCPKEGFILTTDDGTVGIKGTVLPTIESICLEMENPKLFACGPEPMLKAVKQFAEKETVLCELSVESYMGCATGICQGCAIEHKSSSISEHSYHERFSLVCLDGPIYNAKDIRFP